MNGNPIMLIVAAFQEELAADEALEALKMAKKQGTIDFHDAAVIRRDEKNKLHIKETADPGGGRGAAAGGLIGALIGLLAGPAGAAVGAATGALVGGVTAQVIDSGIPDERLREIGEGLKLGTSAIVGIIEHQWIDQVTDQLTGFGADVLVEQLEIGLVDTAAAEESKTGPSGSDAIRNESSQGEESDLPSDENPSA